MKVAIVQSAYIPWMGYFNLINSADVFVFLDSVQWTKRDWRNRNRVRTSQGWSWLTIPVKLEEAHYNRKICEVKIDNSQNWQAKHLGRLESFYKKAPYFDEIYIPLKKILNRGYKYIVDINYELLFWISGYLNLNHTKFLFSQKMDIPDELNKTDRLIWILETIGNVEYYLSGLKAQPYLEINKFEEKKIKVVWHDYRQPYYNQNTLESDAFISNLSILDILFNHGKDSPGIIFNKNKIKKPEHVKIIMPD